MNNTYSIHENYISSTLDFVLNKFLFHYIYLFHSPSTGQNRGRTFSGGARVSIIGDGSIVPGSREPDSEIHSCVVLSCRGQEEGLSMWLTPMHNGWCYGSVSETICHIWVCHFQSDTRRQMYKRQRGAQRDGSAHLKPQHERGRTLETHTTYS